MIPTKNLKSLLDEADDISARVEDAKRTISKIIAEKDQIIAKAAGPDDEAALRKINLLISQEQMANNQLKLANRKIEGIKVRLLNEANSVKHDALETLREEMQRLISRLESKLEEFYPNAADRQRAAHAIYKGTGFPQVPALRQIGIELNALSGSVFNFREFTETTWAKHILVLVTNANSACLEPAESH